MFPLRFVFLPLLLVTTACGGGDAECAIDTDCALFQYCSDEACVPLGGEVDAGPRMDSGGRDAGPGVDAGPSTDSGPMEVGHGNVDVNQIRVGGMVVSHSAFAFFAPPGGSCTVTTEGACSATVCTTVIEMVDAGMVDAGMVDAGPPPAAPNAGEITITGGLLDLTLTPDTMTGAYNPATGTTAVWDGTHTLAINAAGDTVPTFSGSLTPPIGLVLTAPALPMAGTAVVLDRSTDLAVSWEPGSAAAGQFTATLSRSESDASMFTSARLRCAFDVTAGAGTVPATLLGLIPAGTMGTYTLAGSDSVTEEPTGWSVQLSANETVADGAGMLATGSVDFM